MEFWQELPHEIHEFLINTICFPYKLPQTSTISIKGQIAESYEFEGLFISLVLKQLEWLKSHNELEIFMEPFTELIAMFKN